MLTQRRRLQRLCASCRGRRQHSQQHSHTYGCTHAGGDQTMQHGQQHGHFCQESMAPWCVAQKSKDSGYGSGPQCTYLSGTRAPPAGPAGLCHCSRSAGSSLQAPSSAKREASQGLYVCRCAPASTATIKQSKGGATQAARQLSGVDETGSSHHDVT